jgi:N-acetylglucosaminyl-diphospho-decaprenol L-rhamnosyltransferase
MTGIVIVSYNSADVLGRALTACLRLANVEIVVVDNASADGSAEIARRYAEVKVIANKSNRGFAAGSNQGICALPHCSAVLLLNPDAEPLRGIDELAGVVLSPGVGAAGGRLLSQNGSTQTGFNVRRLPSPEALACEVLGVNRIFPRNPWNRSWRMAGFNPDRPADVEQPAGAFLMLNREAWSAVGHLDEQFHPAWFEDVDLCLRLKQAGYVIRYVPDAVARHLGGHSASSLEWHKRQLFWYDNLLRFAAKHYSAAGRRLVAAAVMLGSVPRSLSALIIGRSPGSVSVYIEIFRAAWAAFCGPRGARHDYLGLPSPREENRAKRI